MKVLGFRVWGLGGAPAGSVASTLPFELLS